MAEEKNFENRIKRWFHSVGIYPAGYRKDKMVVPQKGWYVKIWGGGFQKSGIPDILICVSGVFIGCEVKRTNGKPSSLQLVNLRQIDNSSGIAVLLYPEYLEVFKNLILCIIEGDKTNAAYNYNILRTKWKHFENKILKGE